MSNLRELAYQIDTVLWVREVLGIEPTKWQEKFLRAPRGASILALTARQCGKTTTAAWAIAHAAVRSVWLLARRNARARKQSGASANPSLRRAVSLWLTTSMALS
jgi:hypothetical protein